MIMYLKAPTRGCFLPQPPLLTVESVHCLLWAAVVVGRPIGNQWGSEGTIVERLVQELDQFVRWPVRVGEHADHPKVRPCPHVRMRRDRFIGVQIRETPDDWCVRKKTPPGAIQDGALRARLIENKKNNQGKPGSFLLAPHRGRC